MTFLRVPADVESGDRLAALKSILRNDSWRYRVMTCVRDLALPDCWVAAGFVRNAVWDQRGGRKCAQSDVDVIYFDPVDLSSEADVGIEQWLSQTMPDIPWSVKNQARMHQRNGHPPYISCEHALSFWPESATAVAARCTLSGELDLMAPFGLDDLFDGIVRPTPWIRERAPHVFDARCRDKDWLGRWPWLHIRQD